MTKELAQRESRVLKPQGAEQAEQESADPRPDAGGMIGLQQSIGNRAVQRLLAQRSAEGGFEVDDETSGRIEQARGGGQALEPGIQQEMGAAMGHDLSGVRVHSGSESGDLNRQLNAKAFTTGQDVFFRQGDYDPGSSGGRELIAHELTHVVQQGTGAVSGGQKMTVNPPGDVYEQEADSIAHQVAQTGSEASSDAGSGGRTQRQEAPVQEQEAPVQRQEEVTEEPEEEVEEETAPVQTLAIQRQEEEPEAPQGAEEGLEEETAPVQTLAIQRLEEVTEEPEEGLEEETAPVQTQTVQRQDELPEEEV